jgi:hypothetical protein
MTAPLDTTDAPGELRPPGGPLSFALVVSGARCVFVYLILPVLAPVVGGLVTLALPVVVLLYGLGIAASLRAARHCFRVGRITAAMAACVLVLFNLASLSMVAGRVGA